MTAGTTDANFVVVRDMGLAIGRCAVALDPEQIKQAIAEGERAQTMGPILDPTLYRNAGPELAEQLRFLRALLTFRLALEHHRPATTTRED